MTVEKMRAEEHDRPSGALPTPVAPATGEPIIVTQGMGKWFGPVQVLNDINLTIAAGSVVVICGASGSGKSTVLRCICGLEEAQAGTIRVMGRVLNKQTLGEADFRSHIGMVFQRFSLFPHMRVLANMTLAPRKVSGSGSAGASHVGARRVVR
jgi:ABC-type polar amino acid transport system ATPase subunit